MGRSEMSNFKTPLVVSPLPDGKHWKLHTKFAYDCDREGSGMSIIMPAGFVTDGASIPRPLWSLIGSPWGRYGKAAVLHDWLYQSAGKPVGLAFGVDMVVLQRKYADDVFLQAMEVLGVAPWRRNLMYWGVRTFGWLAWRKKR